MLCRKVSIVRESDWQTCAGPVLLTIVYPLSRSANRFLSDSWQDRSVLDQVHQAKGSGG